MKVIQVRGTSGSGKSTAVRTFMGGHEWQARHVPGRKRPLYYESMSGGNLPKTVVMGHYETACGGCDSIGSVPAIFAAMRSLPPAEFVICEGLLLSEDVKWTRELIPDVYCLFLVTPIETCLHQIRLRRSAAGNEKPLSEDNTRNRVAVIERARTKLDELRADVRRCASEQVPGLIRKYLRLHAKGV